jgi:CRISPR-associated exonuclease Cas4
MESDISVSDIVQYAYCPRKVYFLKTAGYPVAERKKMEYGKGEHTREHRRSGERTQVYGFERDDVRKVHHGLYVEDSKIGLYGQIDTVVELKDGRLVPVEVKYSQFASVFKNWKKQLVAYAVLLEAKFNRKVRRGVLYFPKQRKRIDVDITGEDKEFLLKDMESIRKIVRDEKIPRGRDRCGYCEMKKFCKE